MERVGIFEGVAVIGYFGRAFPFLDGHELACIAGERHALEKRALDLAGEFAHGPALCGGLIEIEVTANGIGLREKEAVMRPAQVEVAGEINKDARGGFGGESRTAGQSEIGPTV